jgi:hypothetical protein
MSYATLLDEGMSRSNFLVVMRPKTKVTGFALFSGSVYSVAFTTGYVSSVSADGVALTAVSTAVLSDGQYYYDPTNQVLYVQMTGGVNPSTMTVVAAFELYFGTEAANWYRDPTDSTSWPAHFEPLISEAPVLTSSSEDNTFAVFPITSVSLKIANGDHALTPLLYAYSFNKATIRIYHWLGDDLDTSAIQLIYSGSGAAVTYDDAQVTFRIYESVAQFDKEYRASDKAEKPGDYWSDLQGFTLPDNPYSLPIRIFYGLVEGVPAVAYGLNGALPLPSGLENLFNRQWSVAYGIVSTPSLSVAPSPSSTTSRVYLTVTGDLPITAGDAIRVTRNGTQYYRLVDSVGSNYVNLTVALPTTPTSATSDSVTYSNYGNVQIEQNGVRYQCYPGRDFSTTDPVGLTFSSTLEADVGLPTWLGNTDKVICKVYGRSNAYSSVLGTATDSQTYAMSNGVQILYTILRKSGLAAADIDAAAFVSLAGTVTDRLSFAVPSTSTATPPTYREVIGDILQSLLMRLYVNSSGLWTVSQLSPLGSSTYTIDDSELQLESYEFSFDDTYSDIRVSYGYREEPAVVDGTGQATTQTVGATSTVAKYVHGVSRLFEATTLHWSGSSTAPQTLANRLAYLLGDRRGKLTVTVPTRLFAAVLSNKIDVTRTKLPGFSYAARTLRTARFGVTATQKGLRSVRLVLDDQKGIEDNSGSW